MGRHNTSGNICSIYKADVRVAQFILRHPLSKAYVFHLGIFSLICGDCQVPTPTSQNLEVKQKIRIFRAD
jgi:hypothetical protein